MPWTTLPGYPMAAGRRVVTAKSASVVSRHCTQQHWAGRKRQARSEEGARRACWEFSGGRIAHRQARRTGNGHNVRNSQGLTWNFAGTKYFQGLQRGKTRTWRLNVKKKKDHGSCPANHASLFWRLHSRGDRRRPGQAAPPGPIEAQLPLPNSSAPAPSGDAPLSDPRTPARLRGNHRWGDSASQFLGVLTVPRKEPREQHSALGTSRPLTFRGLSAFSGGRPCLAFVRIRSSAASGSAPPLRR